jgi:two-component system, OmpR family, response regulator
MEEFTKGGLPTANDDPGLQDRPGTEKPLARSPLRAVGAVLEFAGMTLDVDGHHLVGPDGRDVPLTMGELELLLVLLEQPGKVATRDHLMRRLHGRPTQPGDRAIDVQVGRLRRKLEADPGNPSLIKSIRGIGYMLAAAALRT